MIYIFGGSFAEAVHVDSWATKLSKKYNVTNLATPNRSNAQTFLDLLAIKDKLKQEDIIILVCNDYLFPYINRVNELELSVKQKLMEDFIKYFYHEDLMTEHYKFYLNSFKQISEEKNVKLIVLWAAPSNYINKSHWPWAKPFHLDLKKHTYVMDFPNEIRPSLIYYSKLELKGVSPEEEYQMTNHDKRPNHVANLVIHEAIYDKLTKFINNELSGLTYLPT